jgi:NAD(P)-dependent dehydrogenase (short-subunit alcohol dehydrogenase family)
MASPRSLDLNGLHALVTGAASGIGQATAIELARRGARVSLVDIDARRVDDAARAITGARAFAVDVANATAVAALVRDAGPIDVLVSNAGVAVVAPFARTPPEEWDRLVAVNLGAAVTLTRAFLPSISARRGHIAYVASLAGLVGAPGMVAYSTSKFGLVGFAEALRLELADTGVGITTICPGYVKTNLHAATRYDNEGFRRFLDAPPFWYGMTKERVAIEIADAIESRRPLLVLGPEKVGWWLKRVAPSAAFAVTRWVAKRTGVASRTEECTSR